MSNTKKRKKLLWGAMMLMNDIRRCKGWHEPMKSYMRLYLPNGGEGIYRIHIRRIIREEADK